MYRLLYQDGDAPQSYTFSTGEVTIGRSPDCQIVLKDFGISRTHARILVDEDGVRIADLKSKNGTQVNGVQVVEAPLKDGDKILLGKFQLTFSKTLEGKVVLDEDKPLSEEAGTIIRSVGEHQQAPHPTRRAAVVGGGRQEGAGPSTSGDREVEPDPEGAHQGGRDPDRGAAGRRGAGAGHGHRVRPHPRRPRLPHAPGRARQQARAHGGQAPQPGLGRRFGKITISKTIADRVMKDRVSILTSDAMVDPRFGAGDSIRFHGIRSAMCAPLWNKDQVIGIIHVDSPMLTNCFTLNDLDLLTALANYAAVAVERARLNQKIVAEEKKRERLGRFLSPQVTSRILTTSDSQGAALGVPEVKDVCILFADIVGFTSMSEKMSPAAVALLLNDYLSRMTDVIFKYEGTLDKYIGDAIMAVYGAPLDMPDHAAAAVRRPSRCRSASTEFNAERKEGPQLRIRIGINSGKAVAGEIGSINKKEYTVLGDVVNTASRLESSVAKPGMVVIGENTYEAVIDQFECKSMGSFTLKGKEKVVSVFEVISLARRRRRGGLARVSPRKRPER